MTVLKAWWRFFWRYLILLFALLIIGGLGVNELGQRGILMGTLLPVILGYGFLAKLFAMIAVLLYVIGRRFKHSDWILDFRNHPNGLIAILWHHLRFFMTFIIISFLLAFVLGAMLPPIIRCCGGNPLVALQYSRYWGMLSMIPASLLTFWGFMRSPKMATLIIRSDTICR